jgi:uncharacterized membrane protein YqhA
VSDISESDPSSPSEPSGRLGAWLIRFARLPVLVGIVSMFIAATALLTFGAFQTWRLVSRLLEPGGMEMPKEDLILASIKLVDVVMLATVLHLVALGLYGLFVDRRVPVRGLWRMTNIDSLKKNLGGVVVIVLGVVYLEQAISWDGVRDLLSFGLATGAVIAAISVFIWVSGRSHPET